MTDKPKQQAVAGRLGGLKSKGRVLTEEHKQKIRETKLRRDSGRKAAATVKARYGEDFFVKAGAKGGKAGHTGGFYANRELARIAGAKGGRVSRRGKHE